MEISRRHLQPREMAENAALFEPHHHTTEERVLSQDDPMRKALAGSTRNQRRVALKNTKKAMKKAKQQ